jgi:hypothetical protein
MSSSWEEMHGRLVTYYAAHGRGAVPPAASSLGVWTSSQRLEKRHGLLAAEREALLTRAGLEWAPHWSGVTWGQRYAELVAFYEKHQHCRVRYSGGGLGGWVSTQRRAKKAGRLSRERTLKLEEIGFIWDARPDSDVRAPCSKPVCTPRVHGPSLHSAPATSSFPGSTATASTPAPMPVATLTAAPAGGSAISALTDAVNRAVEERDRERNATTTAAAASAAAASAASAAAASARAAARRRALTPSPANTSLSMPLTSHTPPPPSLPAKKRLRNLHGYKAVPDAPGAADPPLLAHDRRPRAPPPARLTPALTNATPTRERVRALVGELVAEALSPAAAAAGAADSAVRRWARMTFVGLSGEELGRVVADGTSR